MLPSSCSQEDAGADSQGHVVNEATIRPCRVILNPWDVSLSYRNGMVNLDSLSGKRNSSVALIILLEGQPE